VKFVAVHFRAAVLAAVGFSRTGQQDDRFDQFQRRAVSETRDPICCVFLRPLSRFVIRNLEELWPNVASIWIIGRSIVVREICGRDCRKKAHRRKSTTGAVSWRMDADLCLSLRGDVRHICTSDRQAGKNPGFHALERRLMKGAGNRVFHKSHRNNGWPDKVVIDQKWI